MPNRRVLVTGVARWWGGLLVQRLCELPEVEEVVGIDTRQPHQDLGRADFLQLDIRHSLIGKLVRAVGIDTVVHTGTTIDSFDLGLRNPEVQVLTLRFANALHAEEPQPLARYLDLELVPTVLGYDPIIQLVHGSDCVDALFKATMEGPPGAYNVATSRPLPLTRLLDTAGKRHAPLLPPVAIGVAAQALRRLGLAFLSPQLLDLLRWGRTLSVNKAARDLGFKARLDTPSALEE